MNSAQAKPSIVSIFQSFKNRVNSWTDNGREVRHPELFYLSTRRLLTDQNTILPLLLLLPQ